MNTVTPAGGRIITVLIVDDSVVEQLLLTRILSSDPQIRVVKAVGDGQGALDFVRHRTADVILMDIHMPGMDGFEVTRRIMETRPVPIIVCSAITNPADVATAFRALEAGAVACVEKPVGPAHPDFDRTAGNLRQTVKLMSEVRVVRRWPRPAPARPAGASALPAAGTNGAPARVKVVGMGASTGGPQVLQRILADLPKTFPVPILVVQHISRGFLPGLAEWLHQTTGFPTLIAAHGMNPQPGHAYLAPDDFHMGVTAGGCILLTREAPHDHLRPAVSRLFRALADVYGPAAVGVLLTGMGRDGAAELRLMKDHGAVTIVQDRDTSVVHGMSGEAIRLGAAAHVLPADRIAEGIMAAVTPGRISQVQS